MSSPAVAPAPTVERRCAAPARRRAPRWSRPAYLLGALVVVQWLAVLAFAVTVKPQRVALLRGRRPAVALLRAYLLAHGHLPPALVGYGWSMMLLPVSLFAGASLVSALPPIVVLTPLVLLPVALLCIYGIASRIGWAVFGYFAALLWIVAAYFGILFVEPGYHQKYTELTLPHSWAQFGARLPEMVALLVSAYFCLRAVDSARWHTAAAAGLAAGWSIAVKPSNSIFLVAPALLLVSTRGARSCRSCSDWLPCSRRLPSGSTAGWASRCCHDRRACSARVRGRGPAAPSPQPEPEQLVLFYTQRARRIARALLGLARHGMASGSGLRRTARAISTRLPAHR